MPLPRKKSPQKGILIHFTKFHHKIVGGIKADVEHIVVCQVHGNVNGHEQTTQGLDILELSRRGHDVGVYENRKLWIVQKFQSNAFFEGRC